MRVLWYIPSLVYAAVIYAIFALSAGGDFAASLANPVLTIALPSGTSWQLTSGHLFIIVALVALFFEILKSTNPTDAAITEVSICAISSLIFVMLFVLARPFGTTEFFLITLMSFLDFMAGCIILVSTARRTIDSEHR